MKKIVATLAIFGLLAINAQAQCDHEMGQKSKNGGFARTMAMGGEGSSNPFLLDPTLVSTNPAYAMEYSNLVWADFGSRAAANNDGTGQFFAANFEVTDKVVAGAILSRNDYTNSAISSLTTGNMLVSELIAIGGLPGRTPVYLNNNVELLGACALNNNITLGLGLAYASSNDSYKPAVGTESKGNASQFGLNIGMNYEINKNNMFDVAAKLVAVSASSEAATKLELSRTVIGLEGRYLYKMSHKFTFIPVIGFESNSGKIKSTAADGDLASSTALNAGAGFNYSVGNLLFAGGLSFVYGSETTPSSATNPEYTNSVYQFPKWNIGAELKVLHWLIARVGYAASNGSMKTKSVATATTTDEHNQTVYDRTGMTLGLGFRLGNLQIDATVNDDILRQGLNNIGGGNPTFAYISTSYAF